MYKPIWDLIAREISPKRAKKDISQIWEMARWSSFDKMEEIALLVKSWMEEIGLKETEIINYPLNGKTHYNGWVMPLAWDARDATLEIVEPKVEKDKKKEGMNYELKG